MAEPKRWTRHVKGVDREFRRLVAALNVILDVDRRIFETSSTLDDLLKEMLDGTCKLTKARFAQVLLRRGYELYIAHSTDPTHKGKAFSIDDCVCGIAVQTGELVISGDVQADFGERYKAMLGTRRTQMRSEVVIPIKSPPPHSVIVGVLNVEWPKPNAFDPDDTDIVVQFARQAGAAIHSARSRAALQLTLELSKFTRGKSPEDAVRSMLTKLAAFFNQQVEIQFLRHEQKTGTLVVECSTVPSTEGINVLVENSFSGLVVQSREARLSNDVRREYAAYFQDTLGGTRSEITVPIFDANEEVIGALNVESTAPDAFTEHDLYLLSVVAGAGVWHRHREMRRSRAVASMAAIGDVAANAIHVLNNIQMPIEEQRRRLLSLASECDASEAFKRELDALGDMLRDVTNRMQNLDEKYQNALSGNVPLDVNRLVAEKRAMITRPDVTFDTHLDPDMAPLQFPPAISDVLWNLVSNAYLAIPKHRPGTITVRTTLTNGAYTHKPEALTIDVIDDGVGMAPAKLETLFRLGNGDRHGYGLWWVKTFVDRCEGTVSVQSEPGRGAHFRLWFPLTADGAARAIHEA
jgi:signal transduction histidine kinase